MAGHRPIRLPQQWSKHVKTGVLHAISLASVAIYCARGRLIGQRRRRRVVARYPGHAWHIDFTTVPTRAEVWVPWFPCTVPQRWPFCWWVAVAIDQLSRVFGPRPGCASTENLLYPTHATHT